MVEVPAGKVESLSQGTTAVADPADQVDTKGRSLEGGVRQRPTAEIGEGLGYRPESCVGSPHACPHVAGRGCGGRGGHLDEDTGPQTRWLATCRGGLPWRVGDIVGRGLLGRRRREGLEARCGRCR